MSIPTLLKEPLVHFLLLGALFFVGYEFRNSGNEGEAGQIVVTQGRIENLQTSFTRIWQRPPTPSEMDGLIRDYVREEVLAREAMTLGLDRDDTVIRRRLRQKMEFIANDLTVPAEPTETELKNFLAMHSDRFLVQPRFSFRQVFLNPEKRGAALQDDTANLLADLNLPNATVDFRMLGDSTMLTSQMANASPEEIARQFGDEFTRQLEQLPLGRWHGPVTSGYGVHMVMVEDRTPGTIPELATIREEVARAWTDERRRKDQEQFYRELVKRYTVTIEGLSPNSNALAAEVN